MRALLAIILLSACSQLLATDRWYGEVHVGFSNVEHSSLAFHPPKASVSFGGYFWKTVGIDVNLGGSFTDDDDDGFDLALDNQGTLSLRFDSPPQNGVSAFVLLGVSQFSLSQRGTNSFGGSRTVRETFQTGTLAFGLRQQLGSGPFSLVGSYRLHVIDEPIDIDEYTLGVRAVWK